MFAEIDFYPATNKDPAIVFRSFSAKTGMTYEYIISPEDLGITQKREKASGHIQLQSFPDKNKPSLKNSR